LIAEGMREMRVPVVISSLKRRDELTHLLHGLGVTDGRIFIAGVTE
jgi:predicted mannosyl-3-phosphoglycerate phosphatase (HAD superfamily)